MEEEEKKTIAEILAESRRLRKVIKQQRLSSAITKGMVCLLLYQLSEASYISSIAAIALSVITVCEIIVVLRDMEF